MSQTFFTFRLCFAAHVLGLWLFPVLSSTLYGSVNMPPSPRNAILLMEESGQTDEERRALRRAQRKLQHKIVHSALGEKLEDPDADAFEQIRGENNQLFDDVRYTREAVLDGDNLELISRRAARQVDKLVEVSTSTSMARSTPSHYYVPTFVA